MFKGVNYVEDKMSTDRALHRKYFAEKRRAEKAEALAASRLKLLRKSKKYFDWFIYEYETDHIEGFEMLLDELAEELGDD